MTDITGIILNNFTDAQHKAASEQGCDIIVRAGAGSGKTGTLVGRYLYLLNENREWRPSDITAVTFTNKAAREMQSRIRERMLEIASAAGDPDEEQFWMGRLEEMDNACIGTIHSLYGRILRKHPAEAGLDPAFQVIDANESAVLIADEIEAVLSEISYDPVYEALLSFYDVDDISKILTKMIENRAGCDAATAISAVKTIPYLTEKVRAFLSDPYIASLIDEYREDVETPGFDKTSGAMGPKIRNLIAAWDESHDKLENNAHPADCLIPIHKVLAGKISPRKDGRHQNAQTIKDRFYQDYHFLRDLDKDKDHDIDWYKERWERYDQAEDCLKKLWPKVKKAYQDALDASQKVDFDGLESRTLELLHNHPEICREWIGRIKALLVDEYQDVNEEQAELFSLLDPDHDRLFSVGDKKQSIYGFRGTNVALFDRRGNDVVRNGGHDIKLDITFRTDEELLQPMGKLLESVMADPDLQGKDFYADYEPMRRMDKKTFPRIDYPRLNILLGNAWDTAQGVAAGLLAQRLLEMKGTGTIGTWDDVAVLCRSSRDFTHYEAALETRKIPYITVAGKGFYDRPEIRDVKNMLRAAENPYDDTALCGFLLSPSIGFTPEMLALLFKAANSGSQKKSFSRTLRDREFSFEDPDKQKRLERARKILSELNRIAGQVTVDEVLAELYRLTGCRTMLAGDSRERAWLNLDKLLMDARSSGKTSVTEFLEYLDVIDDTGAREGEAPSENTGAVRIMTIHQAKGLQFKVTVVGNASKGFSSSSPEFITDEKGAIVFRSKSKHPRYLAAVLKETEREKAEWLRLFYVAATRAEHSLILCGNRQKKDSSSDSWMFRAMQQFPDACWNEETYTGPAYGFDGNTILFRCLAESPETPGQSAENNESEKPPEADVSLLAEIPAREPAEYEKENDFSLTVGKMVHKGIEIWQFPDGENKNPFLESALDKILLQSDRLSESEQKAALDKAKLLLMRFRNSDFYSRCENAEMRLHEQPFSLPVKNYSVNGVIDLLMKEKGRYTIVDFKTDGLKTLSELTEAVNRHSRQLNGYRRAVRMTLGAEPQVLICFLDYCGKVVCEPVGEESGFPEDEPVPMDYEIYPPEEDELFDDIAD